MSDRIALVVVDQEPRIDSRVIATQLGVDHKATYQLISRYQDDLEEFGKLPFEMEASGRTRQPAKFALLNEDQSYLLLTYSQNTPQARELKKRLVRAFGEQRRALANPQPQPLPQKRVIKSRDDLSFTARDSEGRLQNWVVPHIYGSDWAGNVEIGKALFAEVMKLAQHDREEARKAVQYALVEGGAPNFPTGLWGIERGFAEAIAAALFVDIEPTPKRRLPRKTGGAV